MPKPTVRVGQLSYTRDERIALSKLIFALFERWTLDTKAQMNLLGLSARQRSTLYRYRRGDPLPIHPDLLFRVGNLLGIHAGLRVLYPRNPSLRYGWICAPNRRLKSRSPLEVMFTNGQIGIVEVRTFVDWLLQR